MHFPDLFADEKVSFAFHSKPFSLLGNFVEMLKINFSDIFGMLLYNVAFDILA